MTTRRPPRPPSDRDAPRGDRNSRSPMGRGASRGDSRAEGRDGPRSDNRFNNRGDAPRGDRAPRDAAPRGERFGAPRGDARSAPRTNRDDNRGPRDAAPRGERFGAPRSDARSAPRPNRDDNRGPRDAAPRGERFGAPRNDARSAPRTNRDDNRGPRDAAPRGERFGAPRGDLRSAPRREFSRDERRGSDRDVDSRSDAGPWSSEFRSEGLPPEKQSGPRGERSASRTDRSSTRTDRAAAGGRDSRGAGSRSDAARTPSRRGEGRNVAAPRSDTPRAERRSDTGADRPLMSAKLAPRKVPARARAADPAGEVDSEGDLINGPQRIAKLLARAGVGSRRDVERMIDEGRIALKGEPIEHPAPLLSSLEGLTVDGVPVEKPVSTRLYRFYKPVGCLTAARDPMGRKTIYDVLPEGLPRLMPVGRLDYNTEGLMLMTNDGEFKRKLELPASGVERTYRARAFGDVSQAQLEELVLGVEIDGVRYGKIDANLERRTGRNQWIELTLTEGKNREVRNVLEHLGLQVSRLIRVRYGEFSIDGLEAGDVDVVPRDLLFQFRRLLG